jgi:hypothetical protein
MLLLIMNLSRTRQIIGELNIFITWTNQKEDYSTCTKLTFNLIILNAIDFYCSQSVCAVVSSLVSLSTTVFLLVFSPLGWICTDFLWSHSNLVISFKFFLLIQMVMRYLFFRSKWYWFPLISFQFSIFFSSDPNGHAVTKECVSFLPIQMILR